jgi:dTDP-4-dehydrorhamnose 3,5-epimerase
MRGDLLALEQGSNLEFALQRVYCIGVDSAAVIRAEHACSARQVIIAMTGAVIIDLDNGHERSTLRLIPSGSALSIQAGMWLRLRGFLKGTVLLVAASRTYADTAYYDKPQPHLIAEP